MAAGPSTSILYEMDFDPTCECEDVFCAWLVLAQCSLFLSTLMQLLGCFICLLIDFYGWVIFHCVRVPILPPLHPPVDS